MVVLQIPYKYILYVYKWWLVLVLVAILCWERSQFCFTFTTFQCLSYTKLVGCHGPTKRYFSYQKVTTNYVVLCVHFQILRSYIRVYILLYIYRIPFFLL